MFNIEIDENAPAGTYPLILATSYMYQKNAQISGNVSDSRTDVNLWYDTLNQTQALYITVEKLDDKNFSHCLRAEQAAAKPLTPITLISSIQSFPGSVLIYHNLTEQVHARRGCGLHPDNRYHQVSCCRSDGVLAFLLEYQAQM
nr:hypothetical protein KLNIAHKJ_00009 [Methanosarcinales archaeon ANME-2c ERB4]